MTQDNTNPVPTQPESSAPSLFPEVAQWPEPVNGSEILDEVLDVLKKYVITDAETLHAASLWICMTWMIDHATILPLAMITAPEKGCGKSTLLTAMSKMSYKPLQASNLTTAVMFRVIEAHQPTLFIDETDSFLNKNEDMRGIINSGHTKDSACVWRSDGDKFEPKRFSTWSAKALSGIGRLAETIESRSIILKMRRKKSDEHAENLRYADPAVFAVIQQKLARWSADNGKAFATMQPIMEGLSNRDADNYEPLLAIAILAGGDWVNRITKAAKILTHSDSDNRSIGVQLLEACRNVFSTLNIDKIGSAQLIVELCKDEEAPFAAYYQGKPISLRQLAKKLGEYDIHPKMLRFRHETKRGYEKIQFLDAFGAYLDNTPDLPETPKQPTKYERFGISGGHSQATQRNASETGNPALALSCFAVSDDSPQPLVENAAAEKSAEDEWDEYERLLRE